MFRLLNDFVQNRILLHGFSLIVVLLCLWGAIKTFRNERYPRRERDLESVLLVALAGSVVLTMSHIIILDAVAGLLQITALSVIFGVGYHSHKRLKRINYQISHDPEVQKKMVLLAKEHNNSISLDLDQMEKLIKDVKDEERQTKSDKENEK